MRLGSILVIFFFDEKSGFQEANFQKFSIFVKNNIFLKEMLMATVFLYSDPLNPIKELYWKKSWKHAPIAMIQGGAGLDSKTVGPDKVKSLQKIGRPFLKPLLQ